MINKRLGINDIPLSVFNIAGNQMAFVGERNPIYTDIVVEGDVKKLKFIAYFYNLEKQKNSKTKHFEDQCVAILTCNMPKLHLFMREAMRMEGALPNMSKIIHKRKGAQSEGQTPKTAFKDI